MQSSFREDVELRQGTRVLPPGERIMHPHQVHRHPALSRDEKRAEATGSVAWLPLSLLDRGWRGILRPDLDRALVSPAAVFASPHDVVRHPLLTIDTKREILWRWAWDEYLLDLALADGMPEGEPSRLPEVKSALRLVNMHWNPDPAAPAMRVPGIEHYEVPLAA